MITGLLSWVPPYFSWVAPYFDWPHISTFFEAWKVENGISYVGGPGGNISDVDTNTIADFPNTKGAVSMHVEVRYIPGYIVNTPPWIRDGLPGHAGPAGDLPTLPIGTTLFPEWDQPGNQLSLKRAMWTVWNCCSRCTPTSKPFSTRLSHRGWVNADLLLGSRWPQQ